MFIYMGAFCTQITYFVYVSPQSQFSNIKRPKSSLMSNYHSLSCKTPPSPPCSPPTFTYWGPPSTRLIITSHEESLIYKYLLYESRQSSHDHILYYKWCWWSRENLLEVLEMESQISRRMALIGDSMLPIHLMRLGAIPISRNEQFLFSDRLFVEVSEKDLGAFEEICSMVVGDTLYQPMDIQSMYSPEFYEVLLTSSTCHWSIFRKKEKNSANCSVPALREDFSR